jgi:hypothetical protein
MIPVSTAVLPSTPFRGLHEFRYADRAIFFGRSAETAKLFRAITLYRGVLFYGASGTGKSSLINAGLLEQAIRQGLSPERLRFQPKVGQESGFWNRIPTLPRTFPPGLYRSALRRLCRLNNLNLAFEQSLPNPGHY